MSAGRAWQLINVTEPGFPQFHISMTGRDIEPMLAGCAWALLTSALALLITRGVLQRIVALISAVLSMLSLGSSIQAHNGAGISSAQSFIASKVGLTFDGYSLTSNSWWLVSSLLSLIALLASLFAVLNVSTSEQFSQRYDRASQAPERELSTWQALDQGLDPTAESSSGTQ